MNEGPKWPEALSPIVTEGFEPVTAANQVNAALNEWQDEHPGEPVSAFFESFGPHTATAWERSVTTPDIPDNVRTELTEVAHALNLQQKMDEEDLTGYDL